MSEYIKISDIPFRDLAEGHNTDIKVLVAFASDIASLPTIDIVHCEDCTFAKPTNTENVIQCTWLSGYTFRKDHYCSAGERIDNE